ncbi:hypothetical protein BD626DRAFT_538272 [Schizophyllum amplum]|uniref:Uncharacterized protein n=1 Tax=Schizophyllum amplum TaxID=97359 RepID=A0A550C961_9AGAR|nr:hypothetical protein BD626DRAFT_538272 [Auriculariopsis ampla]
MARCLPHSPKLGEECRLPREAGAGLVLPSAASLNLTNVDPIPASPFEPRSSPTPADAPVSSSTPFIFGANRGLRGKFDVRADLRLASINAGNTTAAPAHESSSPPPPEIPPEPLPQADGFPSPFGNPTWPPKPSRNGPTFDPKKAIAQRSGRLMPAPQPPGHASPTAPAASLAALRADSIIPPDDPPEPESRQSMRDVDEINMPALDPPDAKATLPGLADTAAGSSQTSSAPAPKRELRKRVRNGDLKGKGKQKAETPPPTSDSDAVDSPEPERPVKKKRGAGLKRDSDEYVPPGKRAGKGGRGTQKGPFFMQEKRLSLIFGQILKAFNIVASRDWLRINTMTSLCASYVRALCELCASLSRGCSLRNTFGQAAELPRVHVCC